MSYFEIILAVLIPLYLLVGLGTLLVGARRSHPLDRRRFVVRRCSRRVVSRGEPLQVTLTYRAEGSTVRKTQPLDIVLVVDNSGSMLSPFLVGTPLNLAQAALHAFVEQLKTTPHRIGIVRFDDTGELLCNLSTNRRRLHEAIDSIDSGGGTDILEGMKEAVGVFGSVATPEGAAIGQGEGEANNKTILLLTDGDTARADELAEFCRDSVVGNSIRFITIGLGGAVNEQLLREIASEAPSDAPDATGKEYFHVTKPDDLVNVYRSLASYISEAVGFGGTLTEALNNRRFSYSSFDAARIPVRSKSATGRADWILPVIRSTPETIGYDVRAFRCGWSRIAAAPAVMEYYDLDQGERVGYHPGQDKKAETGALLASSRHEKRCLSNRGPRVLVTPALGPAWFWALLLNPLFWIFWTLITRMFRRTSKAPAIVPDLAPLQQATSGPKDMLIAEPRKLELPQLRPTLAIGLGRTGYNVLCAYKSLVSDLKGGEFPAATVKLLHIDTDVRTAAGEPAFGGVSLSGEERIVLPEDVHEMHLRLLRQQDEALSWYRADSLAGLPAESFDASRGTRRLRQIARLVLMHHLRREDSDLGAALRGALDFLANAVSAETPPQVLIVASTCGGTGAGITHDLAYLIQRGLQMKLPSGQQHVCTAGLFAGPHCFTPHKDDVPGYQRTARAFLDELSRFQTNVTVPYDIDYGISLAKILGNSDSPASEGATPISLYDAAIVFDPRSAGYIDDAGLVKAVNESDTHYPAMGDLLSHFTLADTVWQDFLTKRTELNNSDRTAANQIGHISSMGTRSIRLPIGALSEWTYASLARDWIIGRTLWCRKHGVVYEPADDLPEGRVSIATLLYGQFAEEDAGLPPLLFGELEALGAELGKDWPQNWAQAFRSVRAEFGVDYAQAVVNKNLAEAFARLLRWSVTALNDFDPEQSPQLDGALPRTVSTLERFSDLIEDALDNLSRLPVSELSDDIVHLFPQQRADIILLLLHGYRQLADLICATLRRWYKSLLGVSVENQDHEEIGICLRVGKALHDSECSLSSLSLIRSIKFVVEPEFREPVYEEKLKPIIDDPNFRTRLEWRLDAALTARLRDELTNSDIASVLDPGRVQRIFQLWIYTEPDKPPEIAVDPIAGAEKLLTAILATIKSVSDLAPYYDAFGEWVAAHPEVRAVSDESRLILARESGADRSPVEDAILGPSSVKQFYQDQTATSFPLYKVPLAYSRIDLQSEIPVDNSSAWSEDEEPRPVDYVFREEQVAVVLKQLVAEKLKEIVPGFSPPIRHYFRNFERLQTFLYLCLSRQIRYYTAEAGEQVLGLKTAGGFVDLCAAGAKLLVGMNNFVNFPERFPEITVDPAEFLDTLKNRAAASGQAVDFNALPSPMSNEVSLIMRLLEACGGWLDPNTSERSVAG